MLSVQVIKEMPTMNEQDTIEAKIGSHAPDFRLPATNGRGVALSDFRGKKNVVLFFVREFV